MGLLDWIKQSDPIPRLGNGNLTTLGGGRSLREQFGPPHVCDIPPVDAARFLGADYGAIWRCDCGKQSRLIFNQKSGADEFVPYTSPILEAAKGLAEAR